MNYETTIGLEIHAELKTKTKMFCDSANDPDEKRPNVNVCPVCMAHPGTLPAPNKEAIRKVLMVGKALGGKLAEYSRFDRKNYFYPDIPKGYQISQYKFPLVEGGELAGVKITRVHLEEDTGKLAHAADGKSSLVDFNRAGMPLMELVTEPCIKSAEEAKNFAEELQLLLRYLGASDADMEKGQMRVEVNISLASSNNGVIDQNSSRFTLPPSAVGKGATQNFNQSRHKLGTKVEVKNLNSFRAVERAIAYEIERQSKLLESGEKIAQETRGWDEGKQKTFSQREKESAHDYRYFPDPDISPLDIAELDFDLSLPELPKEKRERFRKDYALKDEATEIFVRDMAAGKFFEEAVESSDKSAEVVQTISNYVTSDLAGMLKEKGESFESIKIYPVKSPLGADDSEKSESFHRVNPSSFAKLASMIKAGEINSRAGKDTLKIMFEEGGEPEKIVAEKGLKQTSDEGAINAIVEQVIKENPAAVEEYKNGKENALQFLVGQGMRISRGSANPGVLMDKLKDKI